MTAALGVYGGYKPESSEARALGSFATDKFSYQDQGKNIIQLNNAVGYMSAYMRKMQKGIDDASQNFIQQIQSLISEIFVLFGGGGDTGFDFGDLKYIFQAIGALFGFSNGVIPINLFEAAWHFFSTYIIPVNNFTDLMNFIIDGAIASMLDIFGEIPILGQALQQFAVIVSTIRDALGPLTTALDKLFGAFSGDWLSGDFGAFDPLWDAVTNFFGVITGPIVSALIPIFQVMADWSMPFIDALTNIVDVVTNIIDLLLGNGGDFEGFFNGTYNILAIIPNMITNFIQNGLLGPNSFLNAFNIFGLLNPANIPFLPLSHIGNDVGPNLLVEPGFDDAESISLGMGWIYDTTTGHTTNGSAKATAGSATRLLQSISIPVGAGQAMNFSVWCKWASLTYSGTPISMEVVKYFQGAVVGTDVLFSPVAPGLNQTTWTQFTASYTVPANIDNVKLQFRVNNTTTGGFVWFDDASANKTSTTMPQNWIFNLVPDLGALGDFISNVIDVISSVIHGLPFGIGGVLGDLFDDLTGWFDDTQESAANASDALLGVQATQNIIESSTTGVTTTTATDTTVQDALANQAAQIAAQAAAINALQAQNDGVNNSGLVWSDDIETVQTISLDPVYWDAGQYLEGTSLVGFMNVADGHNAGMTITDPNNAATQMFVYQGENDDSITDYQNNTVIMGESIPAPGIFETRWSSVDVYGRVSDDKLTWTRARFRSDGIVQFEYRVNGGTITQLGTTQGGQNPYGIGKKLGIQPGVGATPRAFRATINDKVVHSVTDTGNVTSLGAGFRKKAIGQRVDHGFGAGKISQYYGNDNQPAPTVGTGVNIFRASTGTVGQGTNNTTPVVFTNNFWDTIENITPGFTVNLTTGGITVLQDGWYSFTLQSRFNNDGNIPTTRYLGWALLRDKHAGAGQQLIRRFNFLGVPATYQFGSAGTAPLYVHAGEEFFGAVISSVPGSFSMGGGDPDGVYCYFGTVLTSNTRAA